MRASRVHHHRAAGQRRLGWLGLDQRGIGMMMAMFAMAAVGIGTSAFVLVSSTARLHMRWSIAERSLENIEKAIGDFRQDVGSYPASLLQLQSPITTLDPKVCGAPKFLPLEVSRWRGPYLQRVVEPSGALIGIGTAAVTLSASPVGKPTRLELSIDHVRVGDAERMDGKLDRGDGRTEGKVQWDAPGNAQFIQMQYVMPISC